MHSKQFQAKHIEDKAVLDVIDTLINSEWQRGLLMGSKTLKRYITASRWDIVDAFKPIPWKIVQAKLTSLKKRGLIDGCAGCTCRGSFVRRENGKT